MSINHASTSGLMPYLFGSDIELIQPLYQAILAELEAKHPLFNPTLAHCQGRTAFFLPYLATEYGYFSETGQFLPDPLKTPVSSYGLISLAIAIDDDVVDETDLGPLRKIEMLNVAALLRHQAYRHLLAGPASPQKEIILAAIERFLATVTEYQWRDMQFITGRRPFDLEKYLALTYKTGCIFENGFRLGLGLAGASPSEVVPEMGRLFGYVLQLLDDLLDLEDDLANFGQFAVTYPMFSYHQEESTESVYKMLETHLATLQKFSSAFKYPTRLDNLFHGLDQAYRQVKKDELETGLPF